MKIVCLIDSLGSGGAQRQIVELAKGFKAKGHDVEIVIYHNNLFYKDDLEQNNIKIKLIQSNNYLTRIINIRKYIRKVKPNVVLSFLQVPSFIATLSGFPNRKWKLIVGERNADPKILSSFIQKFYRYFHLFPDYIVGKSHANIELVKKINPLINYSKLKVIYNIVNNTDLLTKEDSLNSILRITIAGRYEYQKNYIGLIEALHILPNHYKDKLQIECFGHIDSTNSYLKECLRKIDEYNLSKIICFNNATKYIINEYEKSDFIALFSFYEGFPNVIGEAMSLGKPIIVSNVSDIPYLIKDEINGFICDPNDKESIKNVLIKAINSNDAIRKVMGGNNKKLVKELFNNETIIKNYLNLFK